MKIAPQPMNEARIVALIAMTTSASAATAAVVAAAATTAVSTPVQIRTKLISGNGRASTQRPPSQPSTSKRET